MLYFAAPCKRKALHVVDVSLVVERWEWKRVEITVTLVTPDFVFDVDSGFARRSQTVSH